MKVVVTGGAGFIGSHVCQRLLEEGHEVLCVDNLITGSTRNIEPLFPNNRFQFLNHDVTDPFEYEADAIFHLASPASPIGYLSHPIETIMVNSQGTYRMLELAKKHNARFLISSTSEIYGDPLVHPQTEEYWGNVNSIGPRACYDESKRLGETLTMEYYRQYGLDVRIVRIFNTYGPNSQIHDGRMIPNFITQSLKNEALVIYGDGSKTRSICYVSDLVEGLMRAMFQPNTTGEVFNLGNPDEHTVLEYAQAIIKLCNASSSIVYEASRVDDPERRKPNIDKARRVLGWEPKVGMEEGLKQTIEWFRTQIPDLSTVS
ncbi:dTDP-glucose 4,6-dehydratase/UDP-glucuronate decarboxylase [Thermosporothrix hazakensis]|uniref:UDP-glucuronate decarboxylase n=2 Tax=Thermosporothrix TaxID=768650 RepID=A0A326UDU0_THEHA|nr:UDP-glucuronic acid decarboxylase family protein [Thermosporothrix hazakensis]PZW36095.1 dTDP-glucose 4,6-dehydratase/UDP-glucuronate decarboxylase [Thermosporothrix hazakensis]BBH88561.1 NAD-dependent dehydratase [Thermosporothrix sp. COM3]GCE46746.1 NAD-dependent dehydratase [Thermosporothrix hazakensis]